MRLRKPCFHGRYERHTPPEWWLYPAECPGGEFLPEDALMVEKVEGEWPSEFLPVIAVALRVGAKKGRTVPQLDINEQQGFALAGAVLVALDALAASQVGEPGT